MYKNVLNKLNSPFSSQTEVDRELDNDSLLPNSFTYEKYFAGKYLGELARLALIQLHQRGLFMSQNDKEFKKFLEKDAFTAAMLSQTQVENADIGEVLKQELNIQNATKDDWAILKHVCNILSQRCAILVAIPLSVFINRMDTKEHVGIAVTGSLYRYHPQLKNLLETHIRKIVPNRSFHTFLSDDGSGKGAGLVAAVAARLSN